MNRHFALTMGLLLGTALSPVANAQETTGVPGSPSATTTIEGNQLPPPPQKFEGKIERNAAQSTPYWHRNIWWQIDCVAQLDVAMCEHEVSVVAALGLNPGSPGAFDRLSILSALAYG